MLTKIVSEKQMSTGFEDAAIFANPTDCPWVSEDQKTDNFPQVSSDLLTIFLQSVFTGCCPLDYIIQQN